MKDYPKHKIDNGLFAILFELDSYLSDKFKRINPGTEIKFHNILTGYSLGGHVVIRYGIDYPHDVKIIGPVVDAVT